MKRLARKYFLIFFSASLVLVLLLAYGLWSAVLNENRARNEAYNEAAVNIIHQTTENHLAVMVADIGELAHFAIDEYESLLFNSWRKPDLVEGRFIALSQRNPLYREILLLNDKATEVVRLTNPGGGASLQPRGQGRNRLDSFYYQIGSKLARDTYYLSPIRWTGAFGQNDGQPKPVITVILPVYRSNRDALAGILALDMEATALLQNIARIITEAGNDIHLADGQGNWIYRPEGLAPPVEGEAPGDTFAAAYPEIWTRAEAAGRGNFRAAGFQVYFRKFLFLPPFSEEAVEARADLPALKPDPRYLHEYLLFGFAAEPPFFEIYSKDQVFLLFIAGFLALTSGLFSYSGARIMARRKSQFREIEEHEKFLETINRTMVDALIVIDPKGTIKSFNAAATRIFGYTPEEAIGRNVNMLMPFKTAQNHAKYLQDYLATGQGRIIGRPPRELTAKTKGGAEIPIEIAVSEIREGLDHYFIGSIRELTKIRQVQSQLELLAREGTDIVVLRTNKGEVLYASPSLSRILGYDRDEYFKTGPMDLIHPDDGSRLEKTLRELAKSKADSDFVTCRVRSKAGDYVWLETCIKKVLNRHKRPKSYIFSMRDVTGRIEVEDRLRQAQKMDAVGNLTGGISHDFNNLLTAVLGSLEMLNSSSSLSKQDRAFVDIALSASRSGADLTQRLLAFSRSSALKPKTINTRDLLANVAKILPRVLPENINLKVKAGPGDHFINVDPGELENSIINLGINARDAMQRGGDIEIAVAERAIGAAEAKRRELKKGAYIILSVIDTGEGMPAEVRRRAFDPFFSTKGEGKGTGLGLSMVYGFAKQSGGGAVIESERGKGTKVSIFLPVSAPKKEKKAARKAPGDFRGLAGKTVLLVEDDPNIRKSTTLVLGRGGLKVLAAEDSAGAIEIMKRGMAIDLLFTDVILPGPLDGAGIAREFKKGFRKARVLYTSGYPKAHLLKNKQLGPKAHFLPKPYTIKTLMAVLNELLGEK